jgi:hypothetical protein
VRLEQVVDRPLGTVPVVGVSRRVDAQQPAARTQALRLVDRARVPDPVAERLRGSVAVALEQRREALRGDAAFFVQPPGDREVVKGDDRHHAVLVAGVEHAPVVGQRGARELALGRLDARPLEAEPERVEAEAGQHGDVVSVAVIEVACVARRLAAGRGLDVLPPPPVGVRVAPLSLVGGDGGAEQEAFGEPRGVVHPAEFKAPPNAKIDNPPGGAYDSPVA